VAKKSKTKAPNLHEFLASLDREETKPVYAVTGEEQLLKSEALAAVKHKALGDADPSMCYVEFDGDEVEARAVFDELRTLPFLGDRRVVLLEKADKFIEQHKNLLGSYIDSPASSGTLILLLNKLDARTKLAKALAKWNSVVDCQRLYERQIPGWINQRVQSHGKRIAPRAAQVLAEYVGTDLGQLSSQIEKVITYVGERQQIDVDDIVVLADTDRTRTIFELTECIGRKDTQKALRVLNQFTQTGDEAVYVVTMLAWQLRRFWKTKRVCAQEAGADNRSLNDRVLRAIGGSPFFIPDVIRQAGAFTETDLLRRYRMLLDCDIRLKTSGDDPKTTLELLLINLCR